MGHLSHQRVSSEQGVYQYSSWQTIDIGIDQAGRLHFGSELRGTETLNVWSRCLIRLHRHSRRQLIIT